ncbi:MAG: iron-containing alcohol dehydrogenase [Bacilli bacterium]|nr:iron-containing alcohol dehydrogenase [Bacilli bacterium]
MNIFYRAYARTFQFLLRYGGKLLRYDEPKRLNSPEEIVSFLKENGCSHIFLVSGRSTFASSASHNVISSILDKGIAIETYLMQSKEPSVEECKRMGELYLKASCDSIISIGGGSRIDAAKSLALHLAYPDKDMTEFRGALKVHRKLPAHIVIPTTAGSASEDSISMVLTDEGKGDKFAISSPYLLPSAYYFDATYLLEIPHNQGSESAMDAYTHNLEAYLGSALSKKDSRLAVKAISTLDTKIETFYCSSRSKEVALELFEASRIGGYCFSRGYVGYVHALAHALGGKTHLSHGKLIAVLLPYVLIAYRKNAYKKLAYLCDTLHLLDKKASKEEKAKTFIGHIFAVEAKLRIPPSIGVKLSEKDIDEVVDHAYREANPFYPVPRILNRVELKNVVMEANR